MRNEKTVTVGPDCSTNLVEPDNPANLARRKIGKEHPMKKSWLFQALPSYNLTRMVPLRQAKGEWWRLPSYFKQLKNGENVALWQTGSEAGIYAMGKVTSDPYQYRGKWRVNIGYASLLKQPLFRADLRRQPIVSFPQ